MKIFYLQVLELMSKKDRISILLSFFYLVLIYLILLYLVLLYLINLFLS